MVRKKQSVPYFFIVGVGRSGTTLLMSMLNAHPEIAMPPESRFIRKYILTDKKIPAPKALSILKNDPHLKEFSVDIAGSMQPLLKEYSFFPWKRAYLLLLDSYFSKQDKKYIGDKDPKLIEYLPLLHKLFPETKIIQLIRDPRDVFLSRLKAGWSKNKSRFSHLMAYRIQYNLGKKNGRDYFRDNYLEVIYEKLITEPEVTLKTVTEFLGVEYSQHMLEFYRSAGDIVGSHEGDWKKNVLKPVLQNNSGKWKKELKKRQVVDIETVCHSVFDSGLYTRTYYDLSLALRIRRIILSAFSRLTDFFYRLLLKHRL